MRVVIFILIIILLFVCLVMTYEEGFNDGVKAAFKIFDKILKEMEESENEQNIH